MNGPGSDNQWSKLFLYMPYNPDYLLETHTDYTQ